MSFLEYSEVWDQTSKAAKYLRSKGCCYWTQPIDSDCNGLKWISYTFADPGQKARDHVSKAYPNALIAFNTKEAVDRDICNIDRRFFEAIGKA